MSKYFRIVLITFIELVAIASLLQPVIGCAPQSQANVINVSLDSPIQLKINQTAMLKSGNIKAEFVAVAEDSRCPSNVTCIQAGQVTVVFKIWRNMANDSEEISLTNSVSQPDLAVAKLDGYTLKLIKVEPYPHTEQPLEDSDYAVTISFSRT